MKQVGIQAPCSEDFSSMTPTGRGAFCSKCAMEVLDLSTASTHEIKQVFREFSGKRLCARLSGRQEEQLNQEFDQWKADSQETLRYAMLFSLMVAFGLTLFSCNSPQAEATVVQLQRTFSAGKTVSGEGVRLSGQLPDTFTQQEKIITDCGYVAPKHYPYLQNDSYKMEELVELEEVRIVSDSWDRNHDVLGGAVVYTREYEAFLEQEVVSTEVIERDESGRPYPLEFSDKAYPNPLTDKATYELKVPEKGIMIIGLYSIDGRHIRNIHEGELDRGTYEFPLNMENEQSGTFLVVTRSKKFSNSTKLIKL